MLWFVQTNWPTNCSEGNEKLKLQLQEEFLENRSLTQVRTEDMESEKNGPNNSYNKDKDHSPIELTQRAEVKHA